VFERLGFLTNDLVDLSSGKQNVKPINEEKAVLKREIERTTTNDVIQICTSLVKLGEEFNGPIIINDRADTIMEDVSPDRGEEKTDKVVDSMYLWPRWCPPSLTRTQSRSFNDYGLWRCDKRSERSSGMNCSTRSSLGPCRSKNGSGRRHLKVLWLSLLLMVRL
jgi:hypothetical protein